MKRFMYLLFAMTLFLVACDDAENDDYQVRIKTFGYPCHGWIETDDETITFAEDDFSADDDIYYFTENLDNPDTVSIIAQGYYISESEYTESIYVSIYENDEKVASENDSTTITYDDGVVEYVTKAYVSLDYSFDDDEEEDSD
jgi:hypothetical protein